MMIIQSYYVLSLLFGICLYVSLSSHAGTAGQHLPATVEGAAPAALSPERPVNSNQTFRFHRSLRQTKPLKSFGKVSSGTPR